MGKEHRSIDERGVPDEQSTATPPRVEPDLATVVARFVARLREAGVVATPAQSMRLVRALDLVSGGSLPAVRIGDLYWSARATLLTNVADQQVFDRVFGEVFGSPALDEALAADRGDPNSPDDQGRGRPKPSARRREDVDVKAGAVTGAGLGRDDENPDESPRLSAVPTVASSADRLASIDFADLEAAELAALARLMHQLRLTPPLRRGRRSRQDPHGNRLDVRATLRRSPRTGGDPVVRVHRRAKPRPRRVVVLCDISGSMQAYARAYIQFLHAVRAAGRAEVFTFATRLTRLTRELSGGDPQLAVTRAAAVAPDWRGGTRIGDAVKAFIDRYGRRGLARGAVVVVLSDGWERDDAALLGEQMARLRRLAHRVIWVNPRSADPSFAPLAAGMAAALPYCDEFLSGHNLTAMIAVTDAISRR